MNTCKYFVLLVICGSISLVNAAQDLTITTTGKQEGAKVQEAVVPQGQPMANEKELASGKDSDFEEWAKCLELTDEEKAQFLAEISAEDVTEVAKPADEPQEATGKVSAVEDQKVGDSVAHVQPEPITDKDSVIAPEVKDAQVTTN